MAAQADPSGRPALAGQRWSACSPDAVAAALVIKEWSTGVLLLPRLIRPGHPP
jgi:hypothetical protein